MTNNIIFISGIGTNVGKSYATGWLANHLMAKGKRVITQKFIQTGNSDFSEDISIHREVMGMEYTQWDYDHVTAPVIFSYPASPHLAAAIDRKSINLDHIKDATNKLSEKYDVVLLEGAGGLMVPVTEDYFTIDYIKDNNYPVALVTNGMLGSINHTLLSFEALKSRNIPVPFIIYNRFFDEDNVIAADNKRFLKDYFLKESPDSVFLIMPRKKKKKEQR